MAPRKSRPAAHGTAADTTKAVDEFMRALDHPMKREIEAIRSAILGVDRRIAEGINWNAPSFRMGEYFATTNLREKKGIGVILHLGAKARELPAGGLAINDPSGLLRWLAKDREMVVFADLAHLEASRAAFESLVRQWIARA
jgi:hypothetical protein